MKEVKYFYLISLLRKSFNSQVIDVGSVIGSVDFNIEWKKIHESYDPQYITNDIAMLKLAGITNITNLIRPICIPLAADVTNRDWTGTLGWVAGWGSTSFRGPGSAILQVLKNI